jgi:hypothetical protein
MSELNFFSDEWRFIKKKLEEGMESSLRALENAPNEKEADKARGALRFIRSLLQLETRTKP